MNWPSRARACRNNKFSEKRIVDKEEDLTTDMAVSHSLNKSTLARHGLHERDALRLDAVLVLGCWPSVCAVAGRRRLCAAHAAAVCSK